MLSALFEQPDWYRLFGLDTPILEIFLRGSATYLGIFLLLRLVLRREGGTISTTDVLVVVLIADAAQNGMTGDYTSVTDGLLLVATILAWSYTLEWLAYRIKWMDKLVHPPALPLINEGKVDRRNLRKELITMEELMSSLRENGVDTIEEVKSARIEGDGQISVVAYKSAPTEWIRNKKGTEQRSEQSRL